MMMPSHAMIQLSIYKQTVILEQASRLNGRAHAINAGNMNSANPQIDIPGVYILNITDLSNSCVSAPDTVIIFDATDEPDIFIQFPTSSLDCNNPVIALTGGSNDQNVSFQWLDPDMTVISNTEIASNISSEGMYTLIVTNDVTGCTASELVEVFDNTAFPIINILPPSILDCINTESTLDGMGSDSGPDIEYLWSGPPGGIIGPMDEISANASIPGTYNLLLTNTSNGCTSSEEVILQQNIDPPQVEIASPEQLDCSVEQVTLDGSGSSQGNEFGYSWLDDQGNILSNALSFETELPGVYELIVSNALNGCTNSATVTVIENTDVPTDASIAFQNPSCFGDQNGSIVIEQVLGGTPPYIYSLNDGSFSNNNIYSNLSAGNYTLTIEDANGCQWEAILSLQEPPEINLNLGPNIELELGESAVVEANINFPSNLMDTLIWTPDDLIICSDDLCLEGIVNTFNTVSLSATVVDIYGCQASDEVTLVMQKDRRVFIPTAFSPNGDGTNDSFIIYGDADQIVNIKTFQIFNRWGEAVFPS